MYNIYMHNKYIYMYKHQIVTALFIFFFKKKKADSKTDSTS